MLDRATSKSHGPQVIYVTVESMVKRRPEIVWSVLTDLAGLTGWIEGLVEAEVEEGRAEGAGLVLHVVRRDGKRRIEATSEVTAWREPSLLAVETRAGGMLLFDRVTLTPTGEGTKLGVYGEIVFGNRLAELFARPYGLLGAVKDPWVEHVQRVYERSVEALVKRIEAFSERPYR